MAAVQGRPAALLMVEFSSDDEREIRDRVERLQGRLGEASGITAIVRALDPAAREPLWNLRTSSMPLLYGMRGDRKPITFVEDTAVTPARLPEFVTRFRDILQRHGTDGFFLRPRQRGLPAHPALAELERNHGRAADASDHREVTDLVSSSRRAKREHATPGAQRVESQNVRTRGVRGVPANQTSLRSA